MKSKKTTTSSSKPDNDTATKADAPAAATSVASEAAAPARDEVASKVRAVVGEIEREHGQGAIMTLGHEGRSAPVDVVPSGSLALDEALGVGGYARGRIVEVYGPESSGKTTISLHAIANAQRQGGVTAFIDAEHAFDVRYAKAIGVLPDELLVSQPDCGEQALDIAESLVSSGSVDLVVVDSVAALVPRAEIQGDMGDNHVGLHARLMSQALRKLAGLAYRTNTTLLFINQLRMKIGVMFGSPETTTGGNAMKFYSSVRLDVRRIGKVMAGETVVGNRTRVKVVKNKLAPPFTEAEVDIRWGKGIDWAGDLLDVAAGCGVVDKAGAHFRYADKSFGQGRERAREALIADADLCAAIRTETLASLPSKAGSAVPEAQPPAKTNGKASTSASASTAASKAA